MSKIWMVEYGYNRKYLRSEEAFLALGSIIWKNKNTKVKIFEEIESYPADEYRKGLISQRERSEQLSSILENNHIVPILNKLKNLIELDNNKNTLYVRNDVLRKFEIKGMTLKCFKSMINYRYDKIYLLYQGPSSVEYYKLLLSLHKFQKLDDKYVMNRKDNITDPIRLQNWILAKEKLKMEKSAVV